MAMSARSGAQILRAQIRSRASELRFTRFIFWLFALLAAHASAQEVIPDFYRDPGLYPNRSYVNQTFNEHIDPFTGALQHHYVDLHLPGNGGFDLNVVRSYNSAAMDPTNPTSFQSEAGLGWTIHFGRVLKKDTGICTTNPATVADNPVLEMPDGSRQLLAFTSASSPLMLTTQWWRADCAGGSGGLVVYSPKGTRYDMTQLVTLGTGVNQTYAWYTTKITDRNGNYATISYAQSSSPEIGSVTTSDGRSISFTYADAGQWSRRVSSISGAGRTYNYAYTAIPGYAGKYLLTTVTRPGGTSWNYSYNGNIEPSPGSYFMRQATYPQGGVVTYGWGFTYFDPQANPSYRSTTVANKALSTGGNWSFAYSPGNGTYDTTTVTTPAGTVTYRHVGPNYSVSGSVWMVGLLMSRSDGEQTETYSWGKIKISSETYFRPGVFLSKVDNAETNAPVLTQKTVSRDGATYTTSYSGFDGYGNPGSISETGVNGGTRATTLSYYINTGAWIVKQVQNESFTGSSVTRSFDSYGNLLSVTRNGVTTSYSYDGDGNVSSATFPRSLVHNYSSYKRGIPQTEYQPEGISISRVVSDAGNVTSETNGEQRTTSYTYDGLNRVTSIDYPAGSSTTITYGTASKTATRGSLTETTQYDGFGRVTGVTLGGIARSYTVDALGRTTFASDPDASSGTSYQYDILNRITRVSHSADSSYQTIAYGAGSRTVTNERSKSTTFTYRAYGDPDRQFLMGISSPVAAANVSIARNSRDLVTSITQAGITRGYGYNGNDYLTSVTNPETGTTLYGRDAAGNMTSRTVGNSGTTSFGYDSQNRLVSVTYPSGTPAVSQSYTRTGKLLGVTSSAASRSYGYDANDNLTSESVTVNGVTLSASYGYNSLDQLSSITYPRSGSTVSYAPDALGRPTQVSGYVNSVSYWPSGQIRQISYANGTVTAYGQNARLWPSSFSTQKSGTYYSNSMYGYDGVGNLTSISDFTDSSYSRTLTYDDIDRLTNASGPWGGGSITYGGGGNITNQTFGSFNLNYSYDGSNRLSSVSGYRVASYGYDAYGNIVSGAGNSYTYDNAPNLTCINCTDPALKISYAYDGLNRRVSVTKGGVTSYEFHDARGNLLVEYTPSQTNKLIEFIYLGGKRVAQRVSP